MASSSGADPDSTLALLSSDLPAVPDYPCPDDSGEEEVFFGRKSDKEKNGKFSVFTSRPNMDQDRLDRLHRRSWQVGKEPGAASGGQEGGEGSKANFCRYRDRKSLYSASASIEEEEDDDQEGVKGEKGLISPSLGASPIYPVVFPSQTTLRTILPAGARAEAAASRGPWRSWPSRSRSSGWPPRRTRRRPPMTKSSWIRRRTGFAPGVLSTSAGGSENRRPSMVARDPETALPKSRSQERRKTRRVSRSSILKRIFIS